MEVIELRRIQPGPGYSSNVFGANILQSNCTLGQAFKRNATIPRMANLQVILNELKQERGRLDKAIAALTPLTGNTGRRARTGRRTMSAAARAKIAAAQRARWARAKGSQAKPKRKISATGLARIRAAQKARWAKVRAAKKK